MSESQYIRLEKTNMMNTQEEINSELTRRKVQEAVGGVLFNVSNFPAAVQFRILGQDMTPLRTKITDAVLDALGIKVLA